MPNAGGWQKYVWFKKESTWGTGVTPDIWLPVETYDMVATPEFYQAQMYTGVRQRKGANQPTKKTLGGSLTTDFFGYQVTSGSLKSVAQHLIDPAFSGPASLDLDSLTFEMYDPNDSKQHVGMRINSLTIAGSADTNAIKLSLQLMGKQETGGITPPSLVAATPLYKTAMFMDTTFALGGSAATLRSFELTITNNLVVKHVNSTWPTIIAAMLRTVDFKFSLFKTANTYDALRLATSVSDITGQIIIKADHHGTATNTYTTLTIDIDRMNFMGAADSAPLSDLWEQSVDYMVLKPNSSDNDVDLTWGTAA